MQNRDRATEVALFRYALVREPADPALSKAERGRLVRALAAQAHTGPGGEEVRVARSTLDEWIRAWRKGGFEALKPAPRATSPKVPADVFAMAEALRREHPERTAAHICAVIAAAKGWAPNDRTLQRHFRRAGSNACVSERLAGGAGAGIFGRGRIQIGRPPGFADIRTRRH